VLRLLEQVTHVNAANISTYRRQTLSSLADALDFSTAVHHQTSERCELSRRGCGQRRDAVRVVGTSSARGGSVWT
jgi:hypothetical protein